MCVGLYFEATDDELTGDGWPYLELSDRDGSRNPDDRSRASRPDGCERAVSQYDAPALAAVLPEYDIGGVLGEGGWGVVWRGTHRSLRRDVAIKQLSVRVNDADGPQRFAREARMLASLQHPHVVAVHDFVARDGCMAIVMDLLTGGDAFQWNRMTDRTTLEVCGVALAATAGLAHAHGRGIIHRDVKPSNLLFDAEGVVKLVDFGVGRPTAGDLSLVTAPGTVLGSPAYLAPEQALDASVTFSADVYAMATSIFEMLSGRLPFEGGGRVSRDLDLMTRRLDHDAPKLRDVMPSVPLAVAEVVDQGLAREPTARFADARVFGVALFHATEEAFGAGWTTTAGLPIHLDGLVEVPPPVGTPRPARRPTIPVPKISRPADGPYVELLVAEPGKAVRTIALTQAVVIGREGTDVVLRDPETSRRHAALEPEGDIILVRDLGSSNGTAIDGKRLEPGVPAPLGAGGWLDIGATRVVLADAPPDNWRTR